MKFRFYLRALSFFKTERCAIGLLLLGLVAGTVVGLAQAWPFAIAVDSVLTNNASNDWIHRAVLARLPEGAMGQLIALAALAFGLKLTQDILGQIRHLLTCRINHGGLVSARCALYQRLQALSAAYHKSQPQGDALYRLTNDCQGFQAILGVLISLLVSGLTLVVISAILFSRAPGLTLLALSVAPPLICANCYFGRKFKENSQRVREADTDFTISVQRSMSSIALVQAFCREDAELMRFQRSCTGVVRAWFKLHWQEAGYSLSVGLIFGLGGALIFGYGGYLVSAGSMSLGDLTIFMAYLGMLYDPLCKVTGAGASLQGGAVSVQRVFDVLDRGCPIADKPEARALQRQPRALEFHDVHFQYANGLPVLSAINARIQPGEMVAFVGASGVGKSTLLSLLPRFNDPSSGAMTLDGTAFQDIRLKDLRKHIALVSQENIILPTDVAENIAYGKPDASLEEIQRAAALAGIDSFIRSLPEGYATKLAENGNNFSGGQRQRLAIARALLTDAPIIVLDEPTSALDPVQEHLVTETLRALKGSRTVILVSHRLSTVVDCDRIYVLDQGRIAEQGAHGELMTREGLYQQMYSVQSRGMRSYETRSAQASAPPKNSVISY